MRQIPFFRSMFTSVSFVGGEAIALVDDSQGAISPWCDAHDFTRSAAMDAPYALTDVGLLSQCRIDTFRAGGPGGQHTNRTESAVRITHLATGVVTQSQDHRDRARNQADALRRLRLRLALTIRGVSQPTWLDAYRRGRQLILGAHAQSYHLVVAVVLDALDRRGGILANAATELAISSSQLTKLLTADKEVHAAANTLRAKHGQGTIRA